MGNYVYIRSEPGLWTVGFYRPDGKWEPESDYESTKEAAERVAWLNGSWTGEHRIDRLRKALSGLVGSDDKDELEKIKAALESIPAPGHEQDKAASINAINVLIETA